MGGEEGFQIQRQLKTLFRTRYNREATEEGQVNGKMLKAGRRPSFENGGILLLQQPPSPRQKAGSLPGWHVMRRGIEFAAAAQEVLCLRVRVQGPAKRWSPGCVNTAGKLRQKWYTTAVKKKFINPGTAF